MLLQITKEQVIEQIQTSDFNPQGLYLFWQETQKYTKSKKQATKSKSKRNKELLEAQEMFLNHFSENKGTEDFIKFKRQQAEIESKIVLEV